MSKKKKKLFAQDSIARLPFLLTVIFSALFLILPFAQSIGDNMVDAASIKATLVNQEPDPAEAGEIVLVRLKVENAGRENAEDVQVELLPEFPFSLVPGEPSLQKTGSVYGKQIGKIGVILDYRLRAAEDAVEGNYEIDVRYKVKDGPWTKTAPLIIEIKPHTILLGVRKVISSPYPMVQGNPSEVSVQLENIGKSLIRDIKVNLDLANVPFAALESTNEKLLANIGANATGTVKFTLAPLPDAKSSLYKIPLKISFFDRLGNFYTKNDTMGLAVGGEPELIAYLDSSEILSPGESGRVSIRLVNAGVTDVKFLTASAAAGEGYRIVSSHVLYLGNIDSDDYETASFSLSVSPKTKSSIAIPLTARFRDSNNREFEKNFTVSMPLYSSSEAVSLGLKKNNVGMKIFAAAILIAGAGFVYFRLRRKKHKNKELL
ncbi:hypothetical protein HYU14_01755 [Candidatus Woesearchaeota archaeon]|nr:hypothetical protein [Candidatus Woesearchaeota archaeon]